MAIRRPCTIRSRPRPSPSAGSVFSSIKQIDVHLPTTSIKTDGLAIYLKHYLQFTKVLEGRGDVAEVQATLAQFHGRVPRLRADINGTFGMARDSHKRADQLITDFGIAYRDAGLTILFGAAGGTVSASGAVALNVTKSLLDGGLKYYDTGNAGQALLTTTGGLIMCGCSHFEEIVDAADKPVIFAVGLVVDGLFEAGGKTMEGASIQDALTAAFVKTIIGAGAKGVGSVKIKGKVGDMTEHQVARIVRRSDKFQKQLAAVEAQYADAVGFAKEAVGKGVGASASSAPGKASGGGTHATPDQRALHYVRANVLRRHQ